jgi:hypothetical protein
MTKKCRLQEAFLNKNLHDFFIPRKKNVNTKNGLGNAHPALCGAFF